MSKLGILVYSKEELVKQGLSLVINESPLVQRVGEVDSIKGIRRKMNGESYNLVFLHCHRSYGEEFREVCDYLKESSVRCIVVTGDQRELPLKRIIDAGAKGLVNLRSSAQDVFRAIEYAADGKSYYCSQVTAVLFDSMMNREARISPRDRYNLSDREIEVIGLLIKGLSNHEIGTQLFISPRTVESHKRRIFDKMNINSTVQLVHHCYESHLIDFVPTEYPGLKEPYSLSVVR